MFWWPGLAPWKFELPFPGINTLILALPLGCRTILELTFWVRGSNPAGHLGTAGTTLFWDGEWFQSPGKAHTLSAKLVGSEGRRGRWGTPTVTLHIRIQHRE